MRDKKALGAAFAAAAVLLGWLSITAVGSQAQCVGSKGNNTVYTDCGTGGTIGTHDSPSFIDASMFGGSNTDICAVLNGILSGNSYSYPSTGAVIDARGLPGTTGTSMTCAHDPWSGISSPLPATILLPATGGASPNPIIISKPWVIPSNTHLIGEGDGIGSGAEGTTIQVSSTFSSTSGYIMLLGSSSGSSGISVERLTIDGQGGSFGGILNENSGDVTYVDHVSLYQILRTGLLVEGSVDNSGPYSSITFDTGTYSGTTSTVCAQIYNVTSVTNSSRPGGTRGIHGLTCRAATNDPPAAVLLDSSNNRVEDVTIVGFYDGVLVGSNANAQSNILVNIVGDTSLPSHPTPVNAIHISANHTSTDFSIVGVSNSSISGTYTIQDDVTGPHLSDPYVGMYAIGEQVAGVGYPRYTTSPNAATWASGSSAPSGSCSALGSLFSNTGSSGAALSVCKAGGSWAAVSTN